MSSTVVVFVFCLGLVYFPREESSDFLPDGPQASWAPSTRLTSFYSFFQKACLSYAWYLESQASLSPSPESLDFYRCGVRLHRLRRFWKELNSFFYRLLNNLLYPIFRVLDASNSWNFWEVLGINHQLFVSLFFAAHNFLDTSVVIKQSLEPRNPSFHRLLAGELRPVISLFVLPSLQFSC